MIPNSFISPVRPISLIGTWITFLVIIFHGLTVWAVMSLDSPELSKVAMPQPVPIQLELITLPTENNNIESNSQSEPQAQPQPEPQQQASQAEVVTPVEKVKPAPLDVDKTKATEQVTSKLKEEPVELTDEKSKPKKDNKSEKKNKVAEDNKLEKENKQQETEANVVSQVLIIEETKVIIRSNATDDEMSLEDRIRAITAIYNKDQARQRREGLRRDANKRQEDSRVNQEINQNRDKDKNKDKDKDKDKDRAGINNFVEEQASWIGDTKPIADLPLPLWLSTDAQSGDVFIVVVELQVDEKGVITEVKLLESSGSQIIDFGAMIQVRAGQLKPFQKDGVAVKGVVPMSLVYERP